MATSDAACRFRDTVLDWGRQWRLDAAWVHEDALVRLLTWSEDESVGRPLKQEWGKYPPIDHNFVLMLQAALLKKPSVARPTRLTITYPGWDPRRLLPGQYRQGAIAAFKKVLTEYTNYHAQTHPSRAEFPQPTIKAVARFQVLEWSYDRIARHDQPTLDPDRLKVRRRDIRKNIKTFLAFIKLPPRPTHPGGRQTKRRE